MVTSLKNYAPMPVFHEDKFREQFSRALLVQGKAKSASFPVYGGLYRAATSSAFSFLMRISAYYIAINAARGRTTVFIKNPL